MRNGKIMVENNDFGANIKVQYELYELEIDGLTFYIDKKCREEIAYPEGNVSIDDRNTHPCNWFNNSDYLDPTVLAKHFEAFESNANIIWIEEMH